MSCLSLNTIDGLDINKDELDAGVAIQPIPLQRSEEDQSIISMVDTMSDAECKSTLQLMCQLSQAKVCKVATDLAWDLPQKSGDSILYFSTLHPKDWNQLGLPIALNLPTDAVISLAQAVVSENPAILSKFDTSCTHSDMGRVDPNFQQALKRMVSSWSNGVFSGTLPDGYLGNWDGDKYVVTTPSNHEFGFRKLSYKTEVEKTGQMSPWRK